jgi:hypothetical protein
LIVMRHKSDSSFDRFVSALWVELFVNIFVFLLKIKKLY